MKTYQITFIPTNKSFSAVEGDTVLNLANKNNIEIPSICNGDRLCGKCIIKIKNLTKKPTQIEKIFFSDTEIYEGYRLACKTKIDGDLTIHLLNEKEIEDVKVLTTGLEYPIPVQSDFLKVKSEIEKPTLENQLSILDSLIRGIKNNASDPIMDNLTVSYPLLKNLSTTIEEQNFRITSIVDGNEISDILEYNTSDECYGVAVDLGTTTIVGLLVDLRNGHTIHVASRTNPQVSNGADVITRANFIINEKNGLENLSRKVIEAINDIIFELCSQSRIEPVSIYQFSLAGNAIMNHIFIKIDPRSMAFSPYLPTFKNIPPLRAKDIGLNLNPEGRVFILPNISGFVGGDIVGMILSHNLHKHDKLVLGLDIGTNGEIVLGSQKRLLCCATAAGPAFEGGHIFCGMRAASGAIDKISVHENQFRYHIIDNVAPKGICGTGLIDLVAILLEYEVIDETGKILGADMLSEKAKIFSNRIIENGSQNEFIIAFENEKSKNKPIILKQKDVRELQLAKAAISAGISILMSELGITKDNIDEIIIAGAFGSFINKENAQRIGLIPKIDIQKVKSVGNSASIGAKQYLLSILKREESLEVINRTEYIELCTREEFQDRYMEEMLF